MVKLIKEDEHSPLRIGKKINYQISRGNDTILGKPYYSIRRTNKLYLRTLAERLGDSYYSNDWQFDHVFIDTVDPYIIYVVTDLSQEKFEAAFNKCINRIFSPDESTYEFN